MLQNKLLAGIAAATLALPAISAADHQYENDAYEDVYYDDSRYGASRYDEVHTINARVVDVEPVYRYVRVAHPQRECWNEVVWYDSPDRRGHRGHGATGAAIAGGIIGGVIGHQFGSGRGNDIATVAGAVIGSTIGHNAADRNRDHYDSHDSHARSQTVRRCETRNTYHRERQVDGYRVTYAYRGREHTIRMPYRPGRTVAVRVSVTPVGG